MGERRAPGGRIEEREQEAFLFSTFADYKRVFERIVIDPPATAVQWRITGSSEALDMRLDVSGVSIIEFDSDSRSSASGSSTTIL
jgi:hypothetical protein